MMLEIKALAFLTPGTNQELHVDAVKGGCFLSRKLNHAPGRYLIKLFPFTYSHKQLYERR